MNWKYHYDPLKLKKIRVFDKNPLVQGHKNLSFIRKYGDLIINYI